MGWGWGSIAKFNAKYKHFEKESELDELTKIRKDAFLRIISFIDGHRLVPKRLNIIKERGQEGVLSFKGYKLSPQQLRLVGKVIEHEWRFVEADFSDNNIREKDCAELVARLAKLRVLDLSGNQAGLQTCREFQLIFKDNYAQLQELSLQNNSICDKGGEVLLRSLMGYKNIKKLNLAKNQLGLKSGEALGELFVANSKNLRELILHWNKLDEKALRAACEGMARVEASRVRVLDLSWNSIGGSDRKKIDNFVKFLRRNGIRHLDLSFCSLTAEELVAIRQALAECVEPVGFHLEGNAQQGGFPLPVYSLQQVRRIKGTSRVAEKNYFIEEDEGESCYICQGWQECVFILDLAQDQHGEGFLHLDFMDFRALKMEQKDTHLELRRVVPPSQFKFFFSRGNHEVVLSSHERKVSYDEELVIRGVKYPNNIVCELHLHQLNIKTQDDKETNTHVPSVPVLDERRASKQIVVLKRPKPVFVDFKLVPYFFQESLFFNYRRPSGSQIAQSVSRDLELSKIEYILDKVKSKQILETVVKDYEAYLSAYLNLRAVCCLGWSYSIVGAVVLPFFEDFPSIKKLNPIVMELKMLASILPSGCYTKNSMQETTISKRSQFLELLVRIAIEFDSHSKTFANLSKVLAQVLRQFASLERKSPHRWRVERYWGQDCHFILTQYEQFLTKLFYKYSEFKSINGANFLRIFKEAGLAEGWSQFEIQVCFFLSRCVDCEDQAKVVVLDYSEFVEAIARLAEYYSLVPPYPRRTSSRYEPESLPLYLKLEGLIVRLCEANVDIIGSLPFKGAIRPLYEYFQTQYLKQQERTANFPKQVRERNLAKRDISSIGCVKVLESNFISVPLNHLLQTKKRNEEQKLENYNTDAMQYTCRSIEQIQ